MIIKILVIIFVLAVIWKTYVRLKRKEIRFSEAITWFMLWLGVGIVAITPKTTDIVAKFLGVSRGVDLLVYISIIFIFFIIFKLIVKVEKIERNVAEVARKIALKNDHDKNQ